MTRAQVVALLGLADEKSQPEEEINANTSTDQKKGRRLLMKKFISLVIGVTLTLGLLPACATRSDFTAISSKNVNLSGVKLDKSQSQGQVIGVDCQHTVIFFPTCGPPNLKEALDRALDPTHSNLLVDAVIRFHTFYIPFIYGQTCWKAEGVAYDTYK